MGWSEYVQRAAGFGVIERDLMVMEEVRCHAPIARDRMPGWVLKEFEHLNHPYCEADIEIAVRNCLARGWLCVINSEEIASAPPPFSTYRKFYPSSVGLLDGTESGNELAKQIFGDDGILQGA